MEYCLHTKKINTIIKNDYHYTFLNHLNIYDYKQYYNIINSYETFKLRNIYNYLYNNIYKLHKIYNIDLIEKKSINDTINQDMFNNLLNNYIDKDKFKSIIIMNIIYKYYNPVD